MAWACCRGSWRSPTPDAGFGSTDVYWEGTDKDGDGNGVYRKCKKSENTPGWNAYIVTNPPYGGRVGEVEKLTELYRSFGRQLREHCAGYHLAMLCGEPILVAALELADSRRMELQNGGIACELILADL